jgi:hypothetical protein
VEPVPTSRPVSFQDLPRDGAADGIKGIILIANVNGAPTRSLYGARGIPREQAEDLYGRPCEVRLRKYQCSALGLVLSTLAASRISIGPGAFRPGQPSECAERCPLIHILTLPTFREAISLAAPFSISCSKHVNAYLKT